MATKTEEIISEHSLSVTAEFADTRLDVFLGEALLEFSRSYLKKLILQGCITLNDAVPKPSKIVRSGDVIEVRVPAPEILTATPQDIPIRVIFEDDSIVVVNKAPGMVVHPSAGHPDGTLVNALLHYCSGRLSGINGVLRPGIVHRLDRFTSGIVVAAKSDIAHTSLVNQFKNRTVSKRYIAIVKGRFSPHIHHIDAPLGRSKSDFRRIAVRRDVGRDAYTEVVSVLHRGDYSVVHVYPHTGRTHQIRVHLKHIGHPVLCDDLYSHETSFPADNPVLSRCALHSYRIAFDHPVSGERISFSAPVLDDMKAALSCIRQMAFLE